MQARLRNLWVSVSSSVKQGPKIVSPYREGKEVEDEIREVRGGNVGPC